MNKNFLEILKNEKVQKDLINMYKILYTGLYYDNIGAKYLLCVDKEKVVYAYPYVGVKPIINEDIVVTTIKSDVTIPTECFGDITKVKDYDDFVESLREDHGCYAKDFANWSNYAEFNCEGFAEAEEDAWNKMCENCEDDIKDQIERKIWELKNF